MKAKIISVFAFLAILTTIIFVVAYTNIDEKAQDAYNKCTSENKGECLLSLNDFRLEVKNICNAGNNDECKYGMEKYWLTTKDIGMANGYFDAALMQATLLMEQMYMQEETKNLAIEAFSNVVREPVEIKIIECKTNESNCTESFWEWQDTTIRYQVNENGTKILLLNIIYHLANDQGDTMEIFGQEGGGGGTGPPADQGMGVYQTVNLSNGTSITNYYTQMDANIESHSNNWIKLIS